MRSRTPKVLHRLGGRPMLDLILDACRAAGIDRISVVISPRHPEVAEHLDGTCQAILQHEQRGSGHALAQVPREQLAAGDVLVLNGDNPLVRAETLARLRDAHRAADVPATLVSVEDPARLDGRIVRAADGSLERIVEYRDAGPVERALGEINVGLYCFDGPRLLDPPQRPPPANHGGGLCLTGALAQP